MVELPLMPIFFSSAPFDNARGAALDEKGGELFAIDLREDRVEIGFAAVGDPHLLAVEDVVGAIRRKVGAGFGGEGIGPGLRLAEAIGADDFGARELRQVLFFLRVGAEEQERQRGDAGVRAVPSAEGAVAGELLGDHHVGGEIHLHAAVFFGREDGFESESRGFAQKRNGNVEIAMLHFFDVRRDLFIEEFARRAGDGVVLFGEIFGREDGAGRLIFYEEGTADDLHNSGWHNQIRSKIPAAPWPPPTHMVTMP